jgi:cysteinyl-tRNA synthetase
MSKSLGNFALIKDLILDYHPEVIRFFLQSSHYRSELSFDTDSLANAKSALTRIYQALDNTDIVGNIDDIKDEIKSFEAAMNDDLNTPQVFGSMFEMVRKINSNPQEVEKKRLRFALIYIGRTLGILNDSAENFLQYGATINEEMILEKIKARNKARADKDFTKADAIRDDLLALGIMLDDGIHGTTWKKI